MVEIFDCTLRDGSHALRDGFSADGAARVVRGLLDAGVRNIEFGRASGIGSPKGKVSDEAYLEAVAPMFGEGEIGMFCRPDCYGDEQHALATRYGLGFLRVGTHCAKVGPAAPVIARMRKAGIKVRYSLIEAHMLSPRQLADSARKVQDFGAQVVTIMDSAGTMLPAQTRDSVAALVDLVSIPVGFHGHNNLGLSVANGLVALEAGASSLDGALMGLARSAGNAPTEMLAVVLEKLGQLTGIDVFALFDFIEREFLAIAPEATGVRPIDIVFGMVGFHSRNLPIVESVAAMEGVSVVRLIAEAGKTGQTTFDESVIRQIAVGLHRSK
jgi:4-hydroxy 2-oxovalerate aldolase